MTTNSACCVINAVGFDGKEYPTFVTHRKQACVAIPTQWSTTRDTLGNTNNTIDQSKITVISRIVGPEPFAFVYAIGDGGVCGGQNIIQSKEIHGGRYHSISFPYGFPVGKLKYTRARIQNPVPSNGAVNVEAPMFTLEGEFYDKEGFEELEKMENFCVLLPDNVIQFHSAGCGLLYSN